jgi:hypothetical protein
MYRMSFAAIAAALFLSACGPLEAVAPPQPAAPPPPPPKTFSVLFASGSSALSADAQATIKEAAAGYKPSWAMGMTAVGHTDTVGDPAANQALSQRRAAVTKAALVAARVPEAEVTASATGENQLPVQTGNETANAQNRSVVITYGPRDDQGYCRALIKQYREWAGRRDTDGETARAMNQCESGQAPGASIPRLEQVNRDARLNLPVRP